MLYTRHSSASCSLGGIVGALPPTDAGSSRYRTVSMTGPWAASMSTIVPNFPRTAASASLIPLMLAVARLGLHMTSMARTRNASSSSAKSRCIRVGSCIMAAREAGFMSKTAGCRSMLVSWCVCYKSRRKSAPRKNAFERWQFHLFGAGHQDTGDHNMLVSGRPHCPLARFRTDFSRWRTPAYGVGPDGQDRIFLLHVWLRRMGDAIDRDTVGLIQSGQARAVQRDLDAFAPMRGLRCMESVGVVVRASGQAYAVLFLDVEGHPAWAPRMNFRPIGRRPLPFFVPHELSLDVTRFLLDIPDAAPPDERWTEQQRALWARANAIERSDPSDSFVEFEGIEGLPDSRPARLCKTTARVSAADEPIRRTFLCASRRGVGTTTVLASLPTTCAEAPSAEAVVPCCLYVTSACGVSSVLEAARVAGIAARRATKRDAARLLEEGGHRLIVITYTTARALEGGSFRLHRLVLDHMHTQRSSTPPAVRQALRSLVRRTANCWAWVDSVPARHAPGEAERTCEVLGICDPDLLQSGSPNPDQRHRFAFFSVTPASATPAERHEIRSPAGAAAAHRADQLRLPRPQTAVVHASGRIPATGLSHDSPCVVPAREPEAPSERDMTRMQDGCGVCFEDFDAASPPCRLPCSHIFCLGCATTMVSRGLMSCPHCRAGFTARSCSLVHPPGAAPASPPAADASTDVARMKAAAVRALLEQKARPTGKELVVVCDGDAGVGSLIQQSLAAEGVLSVTNPGRGLHRIADPARIGQEEASRVRVLTNPPRGGIADLGPLVVAWNGPRDQTDELSRWHAVLSGVASSSVEIHSFVLVF